MLRDGFDTQALTEDLLLNRIERLNESTQRGAAFYMVVLAATSGWDLAAHRVILGDESEKPFFHRQFLLYLYDIERGELLFNPRDDRLRLYAELFTPALPAEELEEAIKVIEKEMLAYNSLSLQYASEILPYPGNPA